MHDLHSQLAFAETFIVVFFADLIFEPQSHFVQEAPGQVSPHLQALTISLSALAFFIFVLELQSHFVQEAPGQVSPHLQALTISLLALAFFIFVLELQSHFVQEAPGQASPHLHFTEIVVEGAAVTKEVVPTKENTKNNAVKTLPKIE